MILATTTALKEWKRRNPCEEPQPLPISKDPEEAYVVGYRDFCVPFLLPLFLPTKHPSRCSSGTSSVKPSLAHLSRVGHSLFYVTECPEPITNILLTLLCYIYLLFLFILPTPYHQTWSFLRAKPIFNVLLPQIS